MNTFSREEQVNQRQRKRKQWKRSRSDMVSKEWKKGAMKSAYVGLLVWFYIRKGQTVERELDLPESCPNDLNQSNPEEGRNE